MAATFEDIVNGMINVGFGVAATAAEKGKEVLDDLNAKGSEVRGEAAQADFTRSLSDIFQRAGGTFSEVTERLSSQGSGVAERVLDELILARVRSLTTDERIAFLAHVRDLVDSVDATTVTVEVENDEDASDGDASAADAASSASAPDTEA